MTSFVAEHFGNSTTAASTRALEVAGQRAGDMLGGRTVWCAVSLPRARGPAEELRRRMDGAAPEASAATLPLRAVEDVRALAERIEDMLDGVGSSGRTWGRQSEVPMPLRGRAASICSATAYRARTSSSFTMP